MEINRDWIKQALTVDSPNRNKRLAATSLQGSIKLSGSAGAGASGRAKAICWNGLGSNLVKLFKLFLIIETSLLFPPISYSLTL